MDSYIQDQYELTGLIYYHQPRWVTLLKHLLIFDAVRFATPPVVSKADFDPKS